MHVVGLDTRDNIVVKGLAHKITPVKGVQWLWYI